MSDRRFPVTFKPAGVTVWAPEGTTVLDAARSAGILIPAPCGGRGVCGKCGVKIVEGTPDPPDQLEKRGLGVAPSGVRLSCLMKVSGPLTVRPIVVGGSPAAASEGVEVDGERVLAAIDLGTTTVEAVVIGEKGGRELGRAAVPNRQLSFGADVVSRVASAQQGSLPELRAAAEDSVIEALDAACGRAGACLAAVTRLVISGNSVMAASLVADSLEGFAEHPFSSPITEPVELPEGSRVLSALPEGSTTLVLPPIESFVGGDVLSGLLAAGMLEMEETALYVDAGTNAEIVVVSPTGYYVASAAAGPALEGAGISCGGPAAPGGVRQVSVSSSSQLELDVIGGGDAEWLTGSGLVSAIAALKRLGHIGVDGSMIRQGPLESKFEIVDEILAIRLFEGGASPVLLSQTDIRAFQTAKGALAAGMLAVLRSAKIKPKRISRMSIAGGLGAALDEDDLAELGVVPSELAGRIDYAGNASLMGAAMMAASPELVDDARTALEHSTHVELASDPGFTSSYLDSLSLEPFSIKRGFSRRAT